MHIHRLELELEKELKLRQLELQAKCRVPLLASETSGTPTSSVIQRKAFDTTKHLALVPPFRLTETLLD